jgi:type II secretory pathway predicted ATPase ExeA
LPASRSLTKETLADKSVIRGVLAQISLKRQLDCRALAAQMRESLLVLEKTRNRSFVLFVGGGAKFIVL